MSDQKKTATPPSDDEDIFTMGDDDLDNAVANALNDYDPDADIDDDDLGVAADFEAPKSEEQISEGEGMKRVNQADDKEREPKAKADDTPKDDNDDAAADDDAEATKAKTEDTEGEAGSDKDGDDGDTATFETVMEGLDEANRALVTDHFKDESEIKTLFESRAEDLKKFGTTAPEAVKRLVELNDYANRNPHEYAAWVASQVNPKDPSLVLINAAKAIGVDLVVKPADTPVPTPTNDTQDQDDQSSDDDDLFADPEVQKVKADNARLQAEIDALKAGGQPQQPNQIGPDSPAARQEAEITAFETARGADGQLLRPHFGILQPIMVTLMQQDIAAGKQVSSADLGTYYDRAELAHPDTSEAAMQRRISAETAAQQASNLQKQQEERKAATAKAKRASQISGGDHGVARHADPDSLDAAIAAGMAAGGL